MGHTSGALAPRNSAGCVRRRQDTIFLFTCGFGGSDPTPVGCVRPITVGGQGQGLVFRVLFQISTADKTHVFIPCVCPVLVSVLFRFSRGERSL